MDALSIGGFVAVLAGVFMHGLLMEDKVSVARRRYKEENAPSKRHEDAAAARRRAWNDQSTQK